MDGLPEGFWSKWYKANELEKVDLVQSLTLIKHNPSIKKGFEYSNASLFNSYLVDLKEYLESRK